MEIISSLEDFQAPWEQCVITLGDFDGIHLGHAKLLSRAVKFARRLKIPAVAVTYDPSPKKVLKKLSTDSNIFTRQEKITLLQKYPLRATVFLPFDMNMAMMKASDFLQQILLDRLKAKHIVIGYDHKFGRNRHGDYRYLKLAGESRGFRVTRMGAVKKNGTVISSSLIRNFLRNGDMSSANDALGQPYIIQGTVIRGKQRGRTLGIPTANLHIPPEKLLPKEGVYSAIAHYGSESMAAVVNIGFNPTFQNVDLSVEAHLLDFDRDIYGETIRLDFLTRIRDEMKFSSVESLKKQILNDIDSVRKLRLV